MAKIWNLCPAKDIVLNLNITQGLCLKSNLREKKYKEKQWSKIWTLCPAKDILINLNINPGLYLMSNLEKKKKKKKH